MKIFVAPLNWGLGHASRCIPLINKYLADGHEVVIGSDGEAATFLRNYFPQLRFIYLPELHLHYSGGKSQIITLLKQLPHFLHWLRQDKKIIQTIQDKERFDIIISDNRFCLAVSDTYSVYITHQLHIFLPRNIAWLEPFAERWHRRIIGQYRECWVPDYAEYPGLAGKLSHPTLIPKNVKFIGPLSRFSGVQMQTIPETNSIETLAIISGLEPQRSLFEQEIKKSYSNNLLIINGKPPYPTDEQLAQYMQKAQQIISRSGYSSIMDYAALGVLNKVKMIPTPGQTEQEYLAELHNCEKTTNFATQYEDNENNEDNRKQ